MRSIAERGELLYLGREYCYFGIIFRGKVKGKAEVRKSHAEKLTLRQDVLGMNGECIREEESAAIKKNIMTA